MVANTDSLQCLCKVVVEPSRPFCRAVPWNGSTDRIALEKRAQAIQRTGLGRTDIHFERPIRPDFTRLGVAFTSSVGFASCLARCAASRSKSALIRPKSNANRFLHSECQYALVLCQAHNDGSMVGRFGRRQGA